jgi:outer membrane protein TolC
MPPPPHHAKWPCCRATARPHAQIWRQQLPINGEDRFSLTQDFMTMRSVGVMQEITRSDKLKARSARFNREAEAAEASRAVALANLRRDTAMAWLDRYYQERMLDVLRTQRTEAGLQIEAADAAYRGGRGTQADVFAARSMVAQIDDRIRQTEKQIGTAKIRLARWVGDDAAQALDTPPSLESVHLDLSSLDSQLAHHPANCLDGQAGRGGTRRCGYCAEQQAR